MATPLVAGGMALYNQIKPDDSKELIFGNLINTSTPNVDFLAALDIEPNPILKLFQLRKEILLIVKMEMDFGNLERLLKYYHL